MHLKHSLLQFPFPVLLALYVCRWQGTAGNKSFKLLHHNFPVNEGGMHKNAAG